MLHFYLLINKLNVMEVAFAFTQCQPYSILATLVAFTNLECVHLRLVSIYILYMALCDNTNRDGVKMLKVTGVNKAANLLDQISVISNNESGAFVY